MNCISLWDNLTEVKLLIEDKKSSAVLEGIKQTIPVTIETEKN